MTILTNSRRSTAADANIPAPASAPCRAARGAAFHHPRPGGDRMPRLRVAPSTALSAAGSFAAVLALAAIASAAAARTAGAARPAASGAAEKTIVELRGLEDRFNKAYEANDLKAYFDFYSDDMTQLYQQGR